MKKSIKESFFSYLITNGIDGLKGVSKEFIENIVESSVE